MLESGPAAGALARGALRRAERLQGPDVLRHGRHDGQAVPDRGRPPARHARVRGRAHRPLHARLGPADQDADDRHDRDRRRRRVAGPRRHARAARLRAGVRGRRPRAGVLRRRRDAADRHGRRPRARLPRSRVLPRRRDDRSTSRRRETAIRDPHRRAARTSTVEEAAWGIHRLVNEDMASAARVHAAERGHDATGLPLFAFGGAGPVHAFGVGAALGHDDRDRPRRGGRDEQRRRARRAARHRRACAAASSRSTTRRSSRVEPLFAELEQEGAAILASSGADRHHPRALDRHALRRPGLRGHRPGRAGRGPQARVRGGVRPLARPQGPGRADRGDQLARAHPRPGPRPAARRRAGRRRRGAEGHARRLLRRRATSTPRSTTATGWGRARGSTARRSSRSASPPRVVGPGATARVADDGSLIIEVAR